MSHFSLFFPDSDDEILQRLSQRSARLLRPRRPAERSPPRSQSFSSTAFRQIRSKQRNQTKEKLQKNLLHGWESERSRGKTMKKKKSDSLVKKVGKCDFYSWFYFLIIFTIFFFYFLNLICDVDSKTRLYSCKSFWKHKFLLIIHFFKKITKTT